MINLLPPTLKILSYNIQTGLSQAHAGQYITHSWRHLLPHKQRLENLDDISDVLSQFDVVGLQEIDPGSMRSGNINQVEYLARKAGFPYWYLQVNRNLGRFAKFCNAVLSRYRPFAVDYHRLPGVVPGRGAIRLFLGDPQNPLVIITIHLSLGNISRNLQMHYVKQLIQGYERVVIMGDLNCRMDRLMKSPLIVGESIRPVNYLFNTYPSWKPRHMLDHILVSARIRANSVDVLELPYSDHLPVAMEIDLGG